VFHIDQQRLVGVDKHEYYNRLLIAKGVARETSDFYAQQPITWGKQPTTPPDTVDRRGWLRRLGRFRRAAAARLAAMFAMTRQQKRGH